MVIANPKVDSCFFFFFWKYTTLKRHWLAFLGITVDAVVDGKRLVKLLAHGETYEMNSPNLVIRLLPVPGTEWSGNVRIQCERSGLAADIYYYRSQSFLGFGGKPRSVKGRIFDANSLKTIYELDGQWDR